MILTYEISARLETLMADGLHYVFHGTLSIEGSDNPPLNLALPSIDGATGQPDKAFWDEHPPGSILQFEYVK